VSCGVKQCANGHRGWCWRAFLEPRIPFGLQLHLRRSARRDSGRSPLDADGRDWFLHLTLCCFACDRWDSTGSELRSTDHANWRSYAVASVDRRVVCRLLRVCVVPHIAAQTAPTKQLSGYQCARCRLRLVSKSPRCNLPPRRPATG